MNDLKDIIVGLAARLIDAEEKLKTASASADFWYKECQEMKKEKEQGNEDQSLTSG